MMVLILLLQIIDNIADIDNEVTSGNRIMDIVNNTYKNNRM